MDIKQTQEPGVMDGSKITLSVEIDMNDFVDDIYSDAGRGRQPTSWSKFILNEIRRTSIGKMTQEQGEEIRKAVNEAFSNGIQESIKQSIDSKLDEFLGEDIALTDRWGKTTFIGSIEDLLKLQFDDKLLHPVDSDGDRLQGCTSSSQTYVQWLVEKEIQNFLKRTIAKTQESVRRHCESLLEDELERVKTEAAAKAIAAVGLVKVE